MRGGRPCRCGLLRVTGFWGAPTTVSDGVLLSGVWALMARAVGA